MQFAYAVVFVMMLTLGRAYATDDIAFPLRLLLWAIVVALIIVQVRFLTTLFSTRFTVLGVAEFFALVLSSFLLAAELALLKYTPLLPKAHDPYLEFVLFMAPAVFLLGGGALLIDKFAMGLQPAKESDVKAPSSVLTVQAQEHYLMETTESGSRMQRGRLKDRVKELADADGMQVHRSWWVARAAVSRIVKQERDYVVQLKSGETVPVARSRVADLRAAGWI